MGKICGVYCFIHIPDGRRYIGSSLDVHQRHRAHINQAKKLTGFGFHRNMSALGVENFSFEILEVCEPQVRLEREHFYIVLHDSVKQGFNRRSDPTKVGDYTEAIRAAISAAKKGIKLSPAHVANMVAARRKKRGCSYKNRAALCYARSMKGPQPKHTLEARRKMSLSHRAKFRYAKRRRNFLT
jgi:group I intron endonuclease